MRASELRHRVSIQAQSTSVDSYGEPSDTWTTESTVWAMVAPLSGGESQNAEGSTGIVSHRVLMRYNSDVSPKKRLLFGSRILGIESVINKNEKDVELELLCKEETN